MHKFMTSVYLHGYILPSRLRRSSLGLAGDWAEDAAGGLVILAACGLENGLVLCAGCWLEDAPLSLVFWSCEEANIYLFCVIYSVTAMSHCLTNLKKILTVHKQEMLGVNNQEKSR